MIKTWTIDQRTENKELFRSYFLNKPENLQIFFLELYLNGRKNSNKFQCNCPKVRLQVFISQYQLKCKSELKNF